MTYTQYVYLKMSYISRSFISGYHIYPASVSQNSTYIQYLYLRISNISSIFISGYHIYAASVSQYVTFAWHLFIRYHIYIQYLYLRISYISNVVIYPTSLSKTIIYIEHVYLRILQVWSCRMALFSLCATTSRVRMFASSKYTLLYDMIFFNACNTYNIVSGLIICTAILISYIKVLV